MKIVLAFDSFKGCISAESACRAAAEALKARYPDVQAVEIPMSDGGEGLVNCVAGMLDVDIVSVQAHGPLMEMRTAEYAISRDGTTAYMEMASVSGLTLVPQDKRNPLLTTTYGVGDLILDAAARGVEHIVMGIGGSATNDGGMGMIESLRNAAERAGTSIRLPRVTVACDVTNPLCGPDGASAVFGPQKGATPEMVGLLDNRLRVFAERCIAEGKASREMMDAPGAGAAGGLGFGLMACLGAELKSGIDILLDIVDFDAKIRDAPLVITGEGRSDAQTLMGKVPHGILKRCSRQGIPVCLLSGAVDDPDGALSEAFHQVSSINNGDTRPLPILMQPDVALENLRKAVLLCQFPAQE